MKTLSFKLRSLPTTLTAPSVISALALLAAVAVPRATAQTALTGAGATFPYPMYSKWFDEYHKLHPEIQINYQSIGSGGGIRQITEGTVDFGASDGPMNNDQLKAFKEKRGMEVLHFPTVLGADVPTYNLPGVTAELKFTPEALAGIFLGKITKWNDPELAKINPDVKLPGDDIVVVHRSDGSGTTYVWVDYLSKVSEEWKNKVGVGYLGELAGWSWGERKRRGSRTRKTNSEFDRLRRADLRHSEQNALRDGQESGQPICEGRPRLGNRSGRRSRPEYAG